MMSCRLLLLTAVLPEARALARAFQLDAKKLARDGLVATPEIALAIVGIRAVHLPRILAAINPQLLIITGLAGALAAPLKVGDLILESTIPPPPPSPAAPFAFHQGKIHTAASIIATPHQKSALHHTTGALAVDMETAVVATLARSRGIPCIALRAISDSANDSLDSRLLALIDEEGRPRLSRVFALLLRHPRQLPALLRIKHATDLALANLSMFLTQAVASGWPHNRHSVTTLSPETAPPEKISRVL